MHASLHAEITILANKVGFQPFSEGGAAELLESLPLMHEYLEELGRQICKEIQDADDNVI